MWIIYIAVILISLYLTINNRNNKLVNLLLIFLMALLVAAPRVGYDTDAFTNIYNTYADGSHTLPFKEGMRLVPYAFLMRIFYIFGIHTLYAFKFVTILILLLILESRSRKITSNFSMWIFFYACSLFTLDAIQARNHIALCLMMIAFTYLVEGGKNNDIKFCLIMLIAVMIHITFIVYFSLLIAKYADNTIRRYAKPFVIGCIGFIFACYFCRPILNGLTLIPRLCLSKYFLHFFEDQAKLGFVLVFVIYVAFVMMLFYVSKRYKHISVEGAEVEKHNKEHSIILNEMVLLFPLMVLCLYSVSIERFLRNLIVICLFSICNYIQDCQNYLERRNLKIALFLICTYVFVYQNYLTGPASDIVEAVLKGKLFFT